MNVLRARVAALPTSVKTPFVAATLMMIISVVITDRVLSRLGDMQGHHLSSLAEAYLDGLSSAIVPHLLHEDVWETFEALDRAQGLYAALGVRLALATDEAGRVVAASDPRAAPSGDPPPQAIAERFATGGSLVLDLNGERAYAHRLVTYQGRSVGRIYAEADIAPLLAERRSTFWTLVATNAALTLAFAALGYLLVRRLVHPIDVLSRHVEHGRSGPVPLIPQTELGSEKTEFGQLFRRFNVMAEAVNEREALARTLAEEERLASLGRLVAAMAHEINNPLGGLFAAMDTLKRHGRDNAVRLRSVALLERGLEGVRDVVRATLLVYRSDREERRLTTADLDDLRVLIAAAVKRKELKLDWRRDLQGEWTVPAGPVRQASLNLLLNACAASSFGGTVGFSATCASETLILEVRNDGEPLPDAIIQAFNADRDAAPVEGSSGLGLWIVRRIVRELGADASAGPGPDGGGTLVRISVPFTSIKGGRHVA